MKENREDVVQAALIVERWCKEHEGRCNGLCDCPFDNFHGIGLGDCALWQGRPIVWDLEEFLRTRGLKNEK